MNPWRLLYRFEITPWERQEVPRPRVEIAEQRSAARESSRRDGATVQWIPWELQ